MLVGLQKKVYVTNKKTNLFEKKTNIFLCTKIPESSYLHRSNSVFPGENTVIIIRTFLCN